MNAKPKKSTLIEEVRRKQVIDTAIEAIASEGFTQITIAEIAKRVGVSTGVITYHFKNKDDLLEQCIRKLFEAPNAFVIEQVDLQHNFSRKLKVFIEANVEFMLKHRNHSIAMVSSFGAFNSEAARHRILTRQYTKIRTYLTRILDGGKSSGDFRDFSSDAMAQIIFGTLEGLMNQWVLSEKEVDLPLCAETLVDMVHREVSMHTNLP
ncbi:MAG: TetR/AcrR family transcriptional regulator [Candidatus Hydrogenedentota bacterium]